MRMEPSRVRSFLRRQKCVAAAVLHYLADVLLAPTLWAAIDRRGVNVIHAEIESSLDDGDGGVFIAGLLEGSLASQAKDAHFVAGFTEIPSRHGIRGGGTGRRG